MSYSTQIPKEDMACAYRFGVSWVGISRRRHLPLILALFIVTLSARNVTGQQEPLTSLAGQVELARLVDLSAKRLRLNIEYDESTLRGTVTLRLGGSVSDEELWTLTNRVLAARGFTTVMTLDDQGGPGLCSIVKLSEAAGLTPLDLANQTRSPAAGGFSSLVLRLEHQPAKSIIEAIKPVLSRQSSVITDLGMGNLILISDLNTKLQEALLLIERLDVPRDTPVIEKIETQYLKASQLASLVTSAALTRNSLSAKPLLGKVSPTPDDRALILIAPPDEIDSWRELIVRFDERELVEMRTYSPSHFAVDDVSRLIEQTARDEGPPGSGDQWRMVTDALTQTLIITATPSEHERITSLLQRLAEAPTEVRRPMRSFPIRNRGVMEILTVLTELMDAGAIENPSYYEPISNPRNTAPSARQRSSRTPPPPESPPESSLIGSPEKVGREPGDSRERNSLAKESLRISPLGTPNPPEGAGSYTSGGGGGGGGLILTADEGTNTLIAIGESRLLSQLKVLIAQLDVRQPQVMIEALIVSLTEGDTFDFGVELEKLELSGNTLISLSSLFGLGGAGILAGGALPGVGGSGFSGVALSPGDFSVVLRALETINEGRSLSMPKVLVNNNQQATLDSVLQQPFLSTNASDTVATTSFGGTEDAGTSLSVTPQIARGDHLILEYSLSLSTFVGESSDPALPPPRQQNSLSSVVTIPDGYTIVVGGLEITSEAEAVSKIPLLGDLPVVGELFKNRSISQSRSRFYLFIRSTVMRHEGFEDLKYLSDRDVSAADIDDGWPHVQPRIIR